MTYQEFIEFNRNKDQGNYTHVHHIIPKCVGGTDDEDNLIELSWLTHYYAHYLLAKENPDNKKLVNDWKHKGSVDAWLKRCYAWAKETPEDTRKKISLANKGMTLTDEQKEKCRLAHIGLKNPHTEEWNKKISESNKGNKNVKGMKWFNNGLINKRAYECPEGFVLGRLLSEDTRSKMYNAETRKKIGDANRGANNGMYKKNPWNKGVPCTEITKEKIRVSQTGKHWTLIDGKRVWT